MPRPKRDMTVCRHCRLKEPEVAIVLRLGKPTGECKACKNKYMKLTKIKNRFHLDLYRYTPELVAANLQVLHTLKDGIYPLLKNTDKQQVGFILIQTNTIFISVYGLAELFHYEVFGIASYLGNRNVVISHKPLKGSKAPTIDANALVGLTPLDVSERLIWFDKALLAKAVKLVEAEYKAIRAAHMTRVNEKRRGKDVQKTYDE